MQIGSNYYGFGGSYFEILTSVAIKSGFLKNSRIGGLGMA